MAERVRRCQDDDRAALSADPPLRYRRDRKRQLALQKPRRRSLHDPRSLRLRNPDQLRRRERYRQNPPLKGVKIGRRYGVKFERRLTAKRPLSTTSARSAVRQPWSIIARTNIFEGRNKPQCCPTETVSSYSSR